MIPPAMGPPTLTAAVLAPVGGPAFDAATLCFLMLLLVPLAIAGMALVNAGLGRSHSASHSMLSSLCVVSVAAIAYFVFGHAWQGSAGMPSHGWMLGGKYWDWLGTGKFFTRDLDFLGDSPPGTALPLAPLTAVFQTLCVGLAALVPLSAGADRWRLSASCASTVLLAGLLYPVYAHWVWSGGWLAQLGANYGLGHGFVDVGGAGSIQAVAGLTALAITWILGPRRAKYGVDGTPAAIPAHHIVLVLLGCLLMLAGWFGLNAAGSLLFYGVGVARLPLVVLNTLLSAAGSGLTAVIVTRYKFRRPDASLSANGWVAGLVASSAGCAFERPLEALLIGIIAGLLVIFTVEFLEMRLGIDDPGGAVAVHAVAGIWGLLALGLAGHAQARGLFDHAGAGQLLAQAIGVATLLGFVLPAAYVLNKVTSSFVPYRTPDDGERIGMDLQELGAGAYPEFLIHGDEYTQR